MPKTIRAGLGGANLLADESYIYILPNWGEILIRFNPYTEEAEAFSPRLDRTGQEKAYIREGITKNIRFISEDEFVDDNELAVYLENVEYNLYKGASVGGEIYRKIIL